MTLGMDTSDSKRKRQFDDGEGFTLPSKTAKIRKVCSNPNSKILTTSPYETLAGKTAVAGPNGVSGSFSTIQNPSTKKMPPIVAKFTRVKFN
jgi:hypothetical protein